MTGTGNLVLNDSMAYLGVIELLYRCEWWINASTKSISISQDFAWLMMKWCLMSSYVSWHIRDKLWPMPKHGSIILYVHGNQNSLGRTGQDGYLDSHTAPELWFCLARIKFLYTVSKKKNASWHEIVENVPKCLIYQYKESIFSAPNLKFSGHSHAA